jgi:hypothetical protein
MHKLEKCEHHFCEGYLGVKTEIVEGYSVGPFLIYRQELWGSKCYFLLHKASGWTLNHWFPLHSQRSINKLAQVLQWIPGLDWASVTGDALYPPVFCERRAALTLAFVCISKWFFYWQRSIEKE